MRQLPLEANNFKISSSLFINVKLINNIFFFGISTIINQGPVICCLREIKTFGFAEIILSPLSPVYLCFIKITTQFVL